MPEFIGTPDGTGRRVAVVVSRFNETVTRSFNVQFLDEDNAIYKSNANGFEK